MSGSSTSKGSRRDSSRQNSATGSDSQEEILRITKPSRKRKPRLPRGRPRGLSRGEYGKTKGIGKWRNPEVFRAYLRNLKSAKRFNSDLGVHFLRSLTTHKRRRIYARLKIVDPVGYKQIVSRLISLSQKRRAEKRRMKISEMKRIRRDTKKKARDSDKEVKNEIAVAQRKFEKEGIEAYRFIPADGLLDLLAMLRAAGYSKEEIQKKVQVSDAIFDLVTPDKIAKARRNFHAAIVLAADAKVLRDMVDGAVGLDTTRADQIASRRRKLQLDYEKMLRERGDPQGMLPENQESRRKGLEERFGVTLEGKAEEKKDGDKEEDEE